MSNQKKFIIFILVFIITFGSTMFCFHSVGLAATSNTFSGLPLYPVAMEPSFDVDFFQNILTTQGYNFNLSRLGTFGKISLEQSSFGTYPIYTFLCPYYDFSDNMYSIDDLNDHFDPYTDYFTVVGRANMYFNVKIYLDPRYDEWRVIYDGSTRLVCGLYSRDLITDYRGYSFINNSICYVSPGTTIYDNPTNLSARQPIIVDSAPVPPILSFNGSAFGHSDGSTFELSFDSSLDGHSVGTSTDDLKWYQKIFNRLGAINNNIVSLYGSLGGLISPFFSQADTYTSNIIEALENGFNDVVGAFDFSFDLDLSFIRDFFTWFTEPYDSNQLELGSIPFVSELSNIYDSTSQFKNDLQNIEDLETLSFSIPYSILTMEDNINLDFSWYSTIKSKYLNILLSFLYFSFAFIFVRSLPSIICGASATVERMEKQ